MINFSYETRTPKSGKNGQTYYIIGDEFDEELDTTWDEIFAFLPPRLLHPESEHQITSRINDFVRSYITELLRTNHPNNKVENIRIYSNSFDVIKIQLRALGLIEINEDYAWSLTTYGEAHMNQLLAITRTKEKPAEQLQN